eukprot:jgi/Botrbrau1/12006/Bobra.247_2s0011.1
MGVFPCECASQQVHVCCLLRYIRYVLRYILYVLRYIRCVLR